MIALIKWLIFGHTHKWTTINTHVFRVLLPSAPDDARPIRQFTRYTQQCEECGKITYYDAG